MWSVGGDVGWLHGVAVGVAWKNQCVEGSLGTSLCLFLVAVFVKVDLPMADVTLGAVSPFMFVSVECLLTSVILTVPLCGDFGGLSGGAFVINFVVKFALFMKVKLRAVNLVCAAPDVSNFVVKLAMMFIPVLSTVLCGGFPSVGAVVNVMLSLVNLVIVYNDFSDKVGVNSVLALVNSVDVTTRVVVMSGFNGAMGMDLVAFVSLFMTKLVDLFAAVVAKSVSVALDPGPVVYIVFITIFTAALTLFMVGGVRPSAGPARTTVVCLVSPMSSTLISVLVNCMLAAGAVVNYVVVVVKALVVDVGWFYLWRVLYFVRG